MYMLLALLNCYYIYIVGLLNTKMTTGKFKICSYLDIKLAKQTRILAAIEGRSMSNYVEFLIKREVEKAKEKGIQFDL